jgi:hypothetical protein
MLFAKALSGALRPAEAALNFQTDLEQPKRALDHR